MEEDKLLKDKVICYSLIEDKNPSDNIEELEKYLNENEYHLLKKKINNIYCNVKIYKYGLFTTLYYYEIHAIKKDYKSEKSNKYGRIFVKSFSNLNDLVKFSKNFDKDYIILIESKYGCGAFNDYTYNKYNVKSLDDYNKNLKIQQKMNQKKKEIDEILS
jgi:hypothetical protein